MTACSQTFVINTQYYFGCYFSSTQRATQLFVTCWSYKGK